MSQIPEPSREDASLAGDSPASATAGETVTPESLHSAIDKISPAPPVKLTGNLIAELAIAAGAECFGDQVGNSWVSMPVQTPTPHRETLRLGSRALLRRLFEFIAAIPLITECPTKSQLKQAADHLDLAALQQQRELNVRAAFHDGEIFIDCGEDAWNVIRVTSEGWSIEAPPQPLFFRPIHLRPLASPVAGGDYHPLFRYLSIHDEQEQLLVLAWALAALHPGIANPILLVIGPQGSAKTTRCRRLRSLLDPSHADLLGDLDMAQLFHSCANHFVLVLENVGAIDRKAADALCRATTGTATERRKLFTDAEQVLFRYRRSILINGLASPSTRADFLDRCLILNCKRLGHFEPLHVLDAEFERERSAILGGLLDLLVKTLPLLSETPATTEFRPADFAHFGRAVARALGRESEDFDRAYRRNIRHQHQEVVEDSAIARLLEEFAQGYPEASPWIGSISQLQKELCELAKSRDLDEGKKMLRKSARCLSAYLNELGPALADRGVEAVQLARTRRARPWRITSRAANTTATTEVA